MSKCKKDEAAQLKGRPVQQNKTNPNLIMQLTCQSAFFIDDAEEMVMAPDRRVSFVSDAGGAVSVGRQVSQYGSGVYFRRRGRFDPAIPRTELLPVEIRSSAGLDVGDPGVAGHADARGPGDIAEQVAAELPDIGFRGPVQDAVQFPAVDRGVGHPAGSAALQVYLSGDRDLRPLSLAAPFSSICRALLSKPPLQTMLAAPDP